MSEWEIFGVITSLIGFAIAIGTPVIKLNTSITKLIFHIDSLDKGLESLEIKNHKSHERIWQHNESQNKVLDDHEKRIIILEEKER